MPRCTACGALLGPNADWCGQCYSPVSRPATEQAGSPIVREAPTPAPTVSPNGASAAAGPDGASPASSPPPGSAPPLPPDLLLALASSSQSSRGATLIGPRGRNWVTAFIILVAVGTDALFFPYAKYMVAYGILVGAISAFALWRLWSGQTVK